MHSPDAINATCHACLRGAGVVDVHTHILPAPERWPDLSRWFGYAGWIALEALERHGAHGCACARMVRVEQGPQGEPSGRTFFREIDANCWDIDAREHDISAYEDSLATHALDHPRMVQVLSTVPVMFGYWARPKDTLALSRWLNDDLARVCAQRPDRFVGLGTIPMNDPDLACAELERCVRELGLLGVQIGTNVNGLDLGEPRFEQMFSLAQRLGACLFVHPWEMLCAPQPPREVPSPPAMSPRLSPNWSAWLVGMPAETTLAISSVLMSGVLERLPTLRLAFAHGGGSFPGTLGRIEHGFAARPDLCQTRTTTPPRSHVARRPASFYVDSLVHDEAALRYLIDLLGEDRIMLGSDYPFPLGEDTPGLLLASMPGLSAATRVRMLRDTACEFLTGSRLIDTPIATPTP